MLGVLDQVRTEPFYCDAFGQVVTVGLVIFDVEKFYFLFVVRDQRDRTVAAHQYMVIFGCSISDLENLFEEVELPFRVQKSIRLVEKSEAVAILEQLDNGVDVNRLELAVAEMGDSGIDAAGQF
ncbi:hypothetical protein D3C79_837050 [compost metagenome]